MSEEIAIAEEAAAAEEGAMDPTPRSKGFFEMAEKLASWNTQFLEDEPESKPIPKEELDKLPAAAPAVPAAKVEPKPAAKVDPKAAPAKVDVAPVVEKKDEPLPESIKSPKAAEDFKKVRADRDQHRSNAERFETENKQLRAEVDQHRKRNGATSTEEYTKLKTERDALLRKVETIDLANSDRFTGYFRGEMQKQVSTARAVSGEHADAIAKLIEQPRSESRNTKLREIFDQMDSLDADVVKIAMTNIERLRGEREDALSKSSENYQKLKEVEAAEATKKEAETAEHRSRTAEAVLEKARANEAFQTKDGDAEHNQQVAVREEFVRAFINGKLDDNILAWTPVLAAQAIHMTERVVPGLKAQISKLEGQIKGYVGASPRGGDSGADESVKPAKGFKDLFKENWSGQAGS